MIVGLALASCTLDPAQFVVVLQTNMTIPTELDEVRLTLLPPDDQIAMGVGPSEDRSFALGTEPGQRLLPFSFGIAPLNGELSRAVHLRVSARLRGEERFATEVRTRFVPGRILRLDVFLARECVDGARDCSDNETCWLGGCRPTVVNESLLPPFEPDAGLTDAGPDAGPMLDGGQDAGRDAGPFDGGGTIMVVPARVVSCTPGCPMGSECRTDFGSTGLCRRNCMTSADCGTDPGPGSFCDSGGHCTQPCSPFTNEGCPPGDVCGLSINEPRGESASRNITICRAETVSGRMGETCDDSLAGGHDECAAGHYCHSGNCRQTCVVAGSDCSSGTCMSFTDAEDRLIIGAGGELGWCG